MEEKCYECGRATDVCDGTTERGPHHYVWCDMYQPHECDSCGCSLGSMYDPEIFDGEKICRACAQEYEDDDDDDEDE
jgi:hypothetical protein